MCDGDDIEGYSRNNSDDFVGVSTAVLTKNGIPFHSKVTVSLHINVFKKEFEPWGGFHDPERITYPKAYIQRITVR